MTESTSRRPAYARLLDRAVRILAVRDHSEQELRRKLVAPIMGNWCALARDQATRKYGEPLPTVFSEKVKIQRFLLYRGYLMEDIQDIWRNFAD